MFFDAKTTTVDGKVLITELQWIEPDNIKVQYFDSRDNS
jgi:hypothetical protein